MGLIESIKNIFRKKEEKSLKPEPDTLMEVEQMPKKKAKRKTAAKKTKRKTAAKKIKKKKAAKKTKKTACKKTKKKKTGKKKRR